LGSIPFTLVIGRIFKNIDIREHGSGNLGGTNAIRVLGPKLGITAGILDILKAFILVYLAKQGIITATYSPLYLGVATAVGHCYPMFANFKGGKAVSTTMGALLGFSPVIAIISALVGFIVVKITKYVSIGSTVLGITAVLLMILLPNYSESIIASIVLLLFIVYRHIPNYKRLLNGDENKANI